MDENDKAVMHLCGPLALLMADLALDFYGPCLKKDRNRQPVLYICLLNALYGIMKAALLYYRRFIADIKSIGFKLNPYDPCIANKIVDSKQLMLVWHIDDIKISHVDPNTVTRLIKWLKYKYEHIFLIVLVQ